MTRTSDLTEKDLIRMRISKVKQRLHLNYHCRPPWREKVEANIRIEVASKI